ncbi:MAG TPA: phosphomethylpyrimidine synthase ThiC [candidate division Zixibacteria bacterium]|jgi:phosphomethylpyrimidine synthase
MSEFEFLSKDELENIALEEKVSIDFLTENIKSGRIVILKNRLHKNIKPVGIGKGLRTKINANLGTSPDFVDFDLELKKLEVSIKYGADTVMDLSTGGNIRDLRIEILNKSIIPIGTVPIYEAVCNLAKQGKSSEGMKKEELFSVIEDHLETGVDFITVHCGLTKRALQTIERKKRLTGIVSRGGSFLARWMKVNQKENPLYEYYDELLDLVKSYNATLSLGDGLRPGSIADSTDRVQMDELLVLGELVQRAREKGVFAMVEGPGHIPIQEIEANVLLEKKLCEEAPFYVLGPLVIDCAPGYDHIVSAIGGAIAGAYGADFLCYVTPAEHLTLPSLEDVREGIIASRIAAHAADIAKGIKGVKNIDEDISKARKSFEWEKMIALSLDPEKTKEKRGKIPADYRKCGMCGDFCAMRENL